jgi:hypothetical protein
MPGPRSGRCLRRVSAAARVGGGHHHRASAGCQLTTTADHRRVSRGPTSRGLRGGGSMSAGADSRVATAYAKVREHLAYLGLSTASEHLAAELERANAERAALVHAISNALSPVLVAVFACARRTGDLRRLTGEPGLACIHAGRAGPRWHQRPASNGVNLRMDEQPKVVHRDRAHAAQAHADRDVRGAGRQSRRGEAPLGPR